MISINPTDFSHRSPKMCADEQLDFIIDWCDDPTFIHTISKLAKGEMTITGRGCKIRGDPGPQDPNVRQVMIMLTKWAEDLRALLGCEPIADEDVIIYRDPSYTGILGLHATLSYKCCLRRKSPEV